MKLHDANLARLMLDQARLLEARLSGRRRVDLEDADFNALVAWRLVELVNRAVTFRQRRKRSIPACPGASSRACARCCCTASKPSIPRSSGTC